MPRKKTYRIAGTKTLVEKCWDKRRKAWIYKPVTKKKLKKVM